jgi:histidinol phosphatase-like PHP family hydrolase
MDDRVTAFVHQAKSTQMRRYIDNLRGMEVEFDLPDEMMALLRKLEDAPTWPK